MPAQWQSTNRSGDASSTVAPKGGQTWSSKGSPLGKDGKEGSNTVAPGKGQFSWNNKASSEATSKGQEDWQWPANWNNQSAKDWQQTSSKGAERKHDERWMPQHNNGAQAVSEWRSSEWQASSKGDRKVDGKSKSAPAKGEKGAPWRGTASTEVNPEWHSSANGNVYPPAPHASGNAVASPPAHSGQLVLPPARAAGVVHAPAQAPPQPLVAQQGRQLESEEQRVVKLATSAIAQVKIAETSLTEASGIARLILDGPTGAPQNAAVQALANAKKAADDASQFIVKQTRAMGTSEAAVNMANSSGFQGLIKKVEYCKSMIEELKSELENKCQDEKLAGEKPLFAKYDTDGDGYLGRPDISRLARDNYSFVLTNESLDKICGFLSVWNAGVPLQNMARLRDMLALEKTESLENRKKEVREELAVPTKLYAQAETIAPKIVVIAGDLEKLPLAELHAATESVKTGVSKCQTLLATAAELTDKSPTIPVRNDGFDEEARKLREHLLKDFKERAGKIQLALISASASAANDKVQRRVKQSKVLEVEFMRVHTIHAVRAVMKLQGKTADELFEQAGGASTMTSGQFAAFIKSLLGSCPADARVGSWSTDAADTRKVASLYDNLRGLSETLSRERFLNLATRRIYCGTQAVPLKAEQFSFAKVVHELEEGELVEAIDSEVDGPSNTRSARFRTLKDGVDIEGWGLVRDPTGAVLLEPWTALFRCDKETILTSELSLQGSMKRRVAKNELVEALDYEKKEESCGAMRVHVRLLKDGEVGWLSVRSNAGALFLKRMR